MDLRATLDTTAGTLVAWKGEDKLWVGAGGGFDAGVGRVWDGGAEGGWVWGVAETPNVFDFAGREG